MNPVVLLIVAFVVLLALNVPVSFSMVLSCILALVAQGMTYKEVGAKLGLSEPTIKYHMGEIIQRLHLENRAQVLEATVSAGKLTVEYNLKDGHWHAGNVTVSDGTETCSYSLVVADAGVGNCSLTSTTAGAKNLTATYTLGDADVGATIRVVVSYTDAKGTAESLTSVAVGPIANVNDAPVGVPTITGTAHVTAEATLLLDEKFLTTSAVGAVVIGFALQDTLGNAIETRRWAERRRFRSLIVVTSDHGIAFPGAKTTVYEPGLIVPFVVRDLPKAVDGIRHLGMPANDDLRVHDAGRSTSWLLRNDAGERAELRAVPWERVAIHHLPWEPRLLRPPSAGEHGRERCPSGGQGRSRARAGADGGW